MNYCKRCLYPENHPLGIIFDEQGICSGCRVHEEKEAFNWDEREKELLKLIENYRNRPGVDYDCVIPTSGNGDSFWVVDRVKNKYGLNPLLVTYNHHFNTKVGIRNLARLVSELDCDHVSYQVAPDIVKKITRTMIRKNGDVYWHALSGMLTFPAQVAAKFKIPFVIWGVNGWLDQVGMFSHLDAIEMTKKVRKEHGLRCFDFENLIGEEGLTRKDLQAFMYPSDDELVKSRVRGIYLGNYVYWDAQKQVDEMIEKYGYETTALDRTFNAYENIGCWNDAGLNDYFKYLKYGYGRGTDHASRDIRLGRMTREEGIQLARQYDSVKPQKSLELFLEWLGIPEGELMEDINRFRDPRIWESRKEGWTRKDSVENHQNAPGVEEARIPLRDRRDYRKTRLLEPGEEDQEYILMGRTYMDEANFKAVEG